ncbi:IS1634 family transposase [Proteiniclasticum sp. BAD-10]|uniref:IS1634 family transposase n=1 Tax=Proteiniclasticum sediminis TaxID=2804028 RepID=A0A941HRJ9_9CLOT|nr:IS1634 family transposase [Proteiniclasticum sediminis]MBR0577481.1 IS1634 family transposase [Proteiniclasticum sediminis]
MYVAITGSGKYRVIQFREDTRIPGTTKKKTHVIQTLGNYERMLAEDPEIIEKLKAEAKRLSAEKKLSSTPVNLEVSSEEILEASDVTSSYYFGHALVLQLWDQLKLDSFFVERSGKRDAQKVIEAIFYLLLHRCGDPSSVLACAKDQAYYAGLEEMKLDRMYDVLDVLDSCKDDLIAHLCKFFEKNTNRANGRAYYDVTTYSFESTRWGELRMFGFSKDHKNNEVQVVMGLLIDNHGIPVTYELFPGNTMDQNTLIQSVNRLKSLYKMEKITVVADRGLNGGANLEYLYTHGHDFVISYTLKRSAQEFKELVWEESGWKDTLDKTIGKRVSREKVVSQQLKFKVPVAPGPLLEQTGKKRGRPRKFDQRLVDVKIHLTWSAKRATKDSADRERMLEKLKKRLEHPYQLKASVKRGVNQFLEMELETENWTLSEEKIREAERYDGYYAVITNNLDLTTQEVYDIYRGLWKIEESFRVLKTDLKAKPVYVHTDGHIRGHFTLCFLALSMLRYAQHLLGQNGEQDASAAKLMDAIHDPLALVQGEYPNVIVTPTRVNATYLTLSRILGMKPLRKNMTLTQFRSSTKLDLTKNLK